MANGTDTERLGELREELQAAAGRPIVTPAEAGNLTGYGSLAIRKAIKRGDLIATKPAGDRGRLRIAVRELARWLHAGEEAAAPPAPRPVRDRAARSGE